MSEKVEQIFEFGEFRLNITEQILERGGETVTLTPKVFDLLVLLVRNHGHLLDKDTIIKTLWSDSFVEEANLNVNISALRRALGETPTEQKFIETVPRRGYRFVAEVFETSNLRNRLPLDEDAQFHNEPIKNDSPAAKFKTNHLIISFFLAFFILLTVGIIWYSTKKNGNSANAAPIKTIAVLPFKPLTKTENDEALEIGMADALITKLSNLQQITVRPTSAILKYATNETDSLAIGRELKVDAVLEGKIQRVEDKIRVSVQLLRVSDGANIWSDSFDDYFTNIFAVQDSISEKMTAKLSLKLTQDEEEILVKRYTENTEAYNLYLQGKYHHNKAAPEELRKALEFYQSAINADASYVLPYAALSEVYLGLGNYNINRAESFQKARESAEKAINLDPESAEAFAAASNVKLLIDHDFEGAERSLRRAAEIKPKDAGIHHALSFYLNYSGRHDEAIGEMRKAIELEPVTVYIQNDFIRILINARRYDEALEQAKKTVGMDSQYVFARRNLAVAYAAKGLYAEALEEFRKSSSSESFKSKSAFLGYIYARNKNRAEAEEIVSENLRNIGKIGVNYFSIALIYVALDEKDRAFEMLEKSFQENEIGLFSLKVMPELDSLRGDPRFDALVKRVGFPK